MRFPPLEGNRCNESVAELFFPLSQEEDPHKLMAARKFCVGCPAQEQCLEWGMDNERYGIWGGLTEHERSLFGGLRTGLRKGLARETELTLYYQWWQLGGDVDILKQMLTRFKNRKVKRDLDSVR